MYFNEDVYPGWMPGGRIEIASVDPEVGMVFYFQRKLDKAEGPLFTREKRCLGCHAGSATNFLPGLLGRSVFPDENGRSVKGVGSFSRVSHSVDFRDRWGGWYVTDQQHGSLEHMANAIATRGDGGIEFDRKAGGQIEFDLTSFSPKTPISRAAATCWPCSLTTIRSRHTSTSIRRSTKFVRPCTTTRKISTRGAKRSPT